MSSLDHVWGERRNPNFPGFKVMRKTKKAQAKHKEKMERLSHQNRLPVPYENQGGGGYGVFDNLWWR